jgi:S1-C subfamily serine protease
VRRAALFLALTACRAESPAPPAAPSSATPPPPPTAPPPRLGDADVEEAPPLPRDRPSVGGPDFAWVFERVAPAVVGVAGGKLVDGRFEPERFGSGFAWDAQGRIVTSDHVIGDSPVLRVRTYAGRVHEARLVGRDEGTDVALLEVPGLRMHPPRRGTVRDLRPGMWVAAIGNPYGMDHSITVGVVSALGRHNLPPGAPHAVDFVQSDVSVNPGNSGGPLVDGFGHVVAVNTAMLDHGQGLAFSTPIDVVDTVAAALLAHGRFERGFAGLVPRSPTIQEARAAGLPTPRGAVVSRVVAGGPAESAGLQPGDLLLDYRGAPVERPDDLPWLIASTPPGTKVPITVLRGREKHRLELVIAPAKDG